MSVHLILRGKFLLENTNENIELSERFFSYKSLFKRVQIQEEFSLCVRGGACLKSQPLGGRSRKDHKLEASIMGCRVGTCILQTELFCTVSLD